MKYSIGIDIGNSQIRGVLVNLENKSLFDNIVRNNDTILPSETFESLLDPDKIYDIAYDIINDLINDLSPPDTISHIGVTGLMHGMLYVDENGNSASPYFSWQDQRGNRIFKNDTTYCQYIKSTTLRPASTGYGLITHFYNVENQVVPFNAKCITTIQGYVAMRLSKSSHPILHTSDCAALGLYNVEHNHFDLNAISELDLDPSFLPTVSKDIITIGTYNGIDVLLPIGNNQASFYGAVTKENSVLVNVGTGGQVSMEIPFYRPADHLEVRPYFDDTFLLVGTSLSAGSSYDLLQKFFQATFSMFGIEPPEELFTKMTLSAFEAYRLGNPLTFDTKFKGTRKDPSLRGSIKDINDKNFTPMHFSLGVLSGVCNELFSLVESELTSSFHLVGVGNAVRQNNLLQKLLSDRFNTSISVPQIIEEAAYGASLLSLKLKDSSVEAE